MAHESEGIKKEEGQLLVKNYAEVRLQILLKDAEFIRSEALLCISKVRHLAVFSIGMAGAVLPLFAVMLTRNPSSDIWIVILENSEVISLIMVGVVLCSLAILQIYIGVFKQIFSFAAYFRDVLIPDINSTLQLLNPFEVNTQVMRWEIWLRDLRSASASYTADSDLRAEPILIASVSIIYALLILALATLKSPYSLGSLCASILWILVCFFLYRKYIGFRGTLKASTK